MSDVFIAHVNEDAEVSLKIALGLEEAGYATWCYEVDNIPGPSYLLQTGQAVEDAKALILVISPHSLGSRQVTKEIVRAHETGKELVPVLRDISHVEFQTRQPEWRAALGAASSIRVSPEGVSDIIPRIVSGLKASGVLPGSEPEPGHLEQIRKALAEVQDLQGLVPEKTEEPPVPPAELAPEAVSEEPPILAERPKPEVAATGSLPVKAAPDTKEKGTGMGRKSWVAIGAIVILVSSTGYLASAYASASSDLKDANATIADYRAEVTDLEQDVGSLTDDLSAMTGGRDALLTGLESDLESAQNLLETTQSDLANAARDLADAESDLAGAESRASSLQAQVNSLEVEMSSQWGEADALLASLSLSVLASDGMVGVLTGAQLAVYGQISDDEYLSLLTVYLLAAEFGVEEMDIPEITQAWNEFFNYSMLEQEAAMMISLTQLIDLLSLEIWDNIEALEAAVSG